VDRADFRHVVSKDHQDTQVKPQAIVGSGGANAQEGSRESEASWTAVALYRFCVSALGSRNASAAATSNPTPRALKAIARL